MKTTDRQKMCTNCDGRIAADATECPYCSAEQQVEEASAQTPLFKNQSLQASLASLYSPPYSSKNPAQNFEEPKKSIDSFATSAKAPFPSTLNNNAPMGVNPVEAEEQQAQSNFWPLFVLAIGSNLLIIGLLQLFFSDK